MLTLRPFVIAATLIAAVPALGQPAPPQAGTAGPGMGQGVMGQGQGTTGSGMLGGNMMGRGQTGAGGMTPMMSLMMRGAVERIEGRLAYIRAELKITEAQTTQWNAFAEAIRRNADAMSEMRNAMMSQMSQQRAPATLPERLALEDKIVTAHLAALKKTADSVGKLYGALSEEQKKTADSIIVGPMGMPMGMM